MPEYSVPPRLLDYILNAQIVDNYSLADGVDLNGVHYTLSSPSNLPVANQRLRFSVDGSAEPIVPTDLTNLSGTLDVALRSRMDGQVRLTAYLDADSSVYAESLLTFLPVITPTYELTAETLVDNADADGINTNQVQFYLTYGGVGVAAQLRLLITGRLTELVATNSNGYYLASFSSMTDGNFTVRAELYADREVFASKTVYFTPVITYPKYLGSNTVTTPAGTYFIGLQAFLNSFSITAGHNYRIVGIPSNLGFTDDCGSGSVFNYPDQTCDPGLPNDFQHTVALNITPVHALTSGLGQNLHSPRYIYSGAIHSFTVQVYDDGPA